MKTVLELLNEGDKLFRDKKFFEAIEIYKQAEELLSGEDDISTYSDVKIAIGDALYHVLEYRLALDYFINAFDNEAYYDNPYLNLRVGQCYFNLGDNGRAKFYIKKAYELDGDLLFENEQEALNLIKGLM